MNELQTYINSYFNISHDDLTKVEKLFEQVTVSQGDYITKEGEMCNSLNFIISGNIRVYKYQNGKEVTQWIGSPTEFITDLSSLVFDTKSRWNIHTLSECEFYSISKTNYRKLNEMIPKWSQLEKQFIAKCFLMLEDRVFSFISRSSEERFNLLYEANKEIFNLVPLQYLASMLGMTPETLSRIRRKQIS